MLTQSVGVLSRSYAGITKVFKTGFLVEDFVNGEFSGEAVLLADNCSDADGSSDWFFGVNGQAITAFSAPRLTSIIDTKLDLAFNRITDLGFPELVEIIAFISNSGIDLSNNPIGNMTFPSLVRIIGDGSQPDLKFSQNSPTSTPIRTASFPKLQSIVGNSGGTVQFHMRSNTNLSLVEFPMLNSVDYVSMLIDGCALTQSCVNNILIQLDSVAGASGTNVTVDLSGGTSAAPSGLGLVAKNNLTDNGCHITTN